MASDRHSLATPASLRPLMARALDADYMLGILGRELPRLTGSPLRVTACRPRAGKSRSALRRQTLRVTYRVSFEMDGGHRGRTTLLGTLPVTPAFLGPELLEACRTAQGHPAVEPFEGLATFIPELQLGIQVFPVDVALPALVEATRPDEGCLVAPFLRECSEGARIERVRPELLQYKPASRCTLKFTVGLARPDGAVSERVVYGKIFADDRGEAIYRDMGALWQAAQGAECLRVPEPLGYDPRRRMLMMAEAPGEHDLKRWVDCLENERPLPPGVDRARLDRSMAVVAQMLAELHRSGIQPRETRTFKSELDEQRNDLELMRHGQPALGRGIERVLERLEADAPVDEPLVPSHGDFRLGQLIGNERRMTLLDWDSPALAHPALNAAMFLRRLRQEPIIHPGKLEELERLADVFRHEFLAREPEVDRCSLARYEALTLSAGALRALRHPKRGAAAIDRFLAEAGRLLNGGSGGVNPP